VLNSTRRAFLQTAGGFSLASILPSGALAADIEPAAWSTTIEPAIETEPRPESEQRLFIKSKRTGEVFDDVYKQGILIYEDALAEIDHLLRDWRRDETITMDRELIDLLATIQTETGYDEPITVISGYRSKSTNEMLRRRMRKVAKNSYHIKGMAVDFRIKDVSTRTIRTIAMHEKIGGVGYYPKRGFLHIDTGPIRSWRG